MDLPQKEPEASTSTGKGKRKNKDGMGWCWIDWVGGMRQEIACDRFYHLLNIIKRKLKGRLYNRFMQLYHCISVSLYICISVSHVSLSHKDVSLYHMYHCITVSVYHHTYTCYLVRNFFVLSFVLPVFSFVH